MDGTTIIDYADQVDQIEPGKLADPTDIGSIIDAIDEKSVGFLSSVMTKIEPIAYTTNEFDELSIDKHSFHTNKIIRTIYDLTDHKEKFDFATHCEDICVSWHKFRYISTGVSNDLSISPLTDSLRRIYLFFSPYFARFAASASCNVMQIVFTTGEIISILKLKGCTGVDVSGDIVSNYNRYVDRKFKIYFCNTVSEDDMASYFTYALILDWHKKTEKETVFECANYDYVAGKIYFSDEIRDVMLQTYLDDHLIKSKDIL